ncbi:hypothetical protein TrCOL_g7351 [Triparma columacea]|uniref:Centrosomin N-terminal motif 1 domain-containing protein n=1 Tax=Triparma columacea TaxID=722753 RepID=A0A9W7GMZ4_9STRA|nr:hypothetical protein TrCOL_g7351 [Triparma columacea]
MSSPPPPWHSAGKVTPKSAAELFPTPDTSKQTPTSLSKRPPPPPNTLHKESSESKLAQRENFELKMRVFYLEEKLAGMVRDDDDDVTVGEGYRYIENEERKEEKEIGGGRRDRGGGIGGKRGEEDMEIMRMQLMETKLALEEQLESRVGEYNTLLDAFKLLEANQIRLQSDNDALKSEANRDRTLRMELTAKTEELEAVKIRNKELERIHGNVEKEAERRIEKAVADATEKNSSATSRITMVERKLSSATKELAECKRENSDKITDLTDKLTKALATSKELAVDLEKSRLEYSNLKASAQDGSIENQHCKERLTKCVAELSEARDKLALSQALSVELHGVKSVASELTLRNGYLEDRVRLLEGSEEDMEREVGRVRREGKRREGALKIAMSQWESLLDLYVGDFVDYSDHSTSGVQSPVGRGRNDSVSSVDWRKGLQDASRTGGLDLGEKELPDFEVEVIASPREVLGSTTGRGSNRRGDVTSPRRIDYQEQQGGGERKKGRKGKGKNVYDDDDADYVADAFIKRVSAKLRSLAGCKKAFQDIVRGAVQEQERSYARMRKLVEEKGALATKARELVMKVKDNFEKKEGERKRELGDIQNGLLASERMLVGEKEALEVELKSEKRLRERSDKELEEEREKARELTAELENVRSNYSLAQKGLQAGKEAVADAMERMSKILEERSRLGEENDGLGREVQRLEGDRARLMDVCERMREQVGYRDVNLAALAGDVMGGVGRGVDLSRYANDVQGKQQQQGARAYVSVTDSIVARELEETRKVLEEGGEGVGTLGGSFMGSFGEQKQKEQGIFTPTFLRTTPGHGAFSGSKSFVESSTPSYIAPPLEEQRRRNGIRMELDRKLAAAADMVGVIVEVVRESERLASEFKALRGSEGGRGGDEGGNGIVTGRKILALEGECYRLLDNNARVAVQMQRLGLDLQRVYRRFKNLEGGREEKGGRKGMGKRGGGRGGEVHLDLENGADGASGNNEDVERLYNDLKEGLEFMEGEEKVKAERFVAKFERDKELRGRGEGTKSKGGGTPGSAKLEDIGKGLEDVKMRLEKIERR